MMLYETTSPDGHRLRLDRIDGASSICIVDDSDEAAIALAPRQAADLSDALAGDLRERVRRLTHAIDELKNPALQLELRSMLAAHLKSSAAHLIGAAL